ncbi:hypothetical protein BGZ83_003331 [Gryganskiella cystojenkinii]|nr:hypothetical protein BGZ83_003331 [Gryganskiella cystojenkinii]
MVDGSDDSVTGEQTLIDHHWTLAVKRPQGKPTKIAPGRYEGRFEVALDCSKLPSSSTYKRGGIEYTLEARIFRKWSSDLIQTQRIWFLGTTLPAVPSSLGPTVANITGHWKEKLAYNIILPSDVFFLGQRVPITFRFGMASKDFSTPMVQFVNPRLRLKQYYRLSTTSGNTTSNKHKHNLIDVEMSHWTSKNQDLQRSLRKKEGTALTTTTDFEDTVLLQLPTFPELSPTVETNVYSVRHSLNLATEVIGKDISGTMKIKVNVKITGPRPPPDWAPSSILEGKLQVSTLEVK